MPNSKKLPTVCHACRSRRAKCDKKRPGCTQCLRKFIQCPGYFNPTELYVRDQTQFVTRKARKCPLRLPRRLSSLSLPSTASTVQECPCSSPRVQSRTRSSPRPAVRGGPQTGSDEATGNPISYVTESLSQPIELVTITFFLHRYVPNSRFSTILGPSFIAPFLAASTPTSSALAAVSLAYFSIEHSSPSAHRSADTHYCVALRHTNAWLSEPAQALLDGTLLAVLLLGLFESLALRGRRALASWFTHAHGTLSLLRLRGSARLESACERALLAIAADNIRMGCIIRAEPVPSDLAILEAQARLKDSTACGPALRPNRSLVQFMDQFVALRIALQAPSGTERKYTDLVRQARRLDGFMLARMPALPMNRGPSATAGSDAGLENLRLAKVWLVMHMVRFFLNYELLRALSVMFESGAWGDELELVDDLFGFGDAGLANIKAITDDIMTAVPRFVDPADGGTAMLARYLVWPLTCLAKSEFCQPVASASIVKLLRLLTKRWNLSPAEEAVKMLQNSASPKDW
ncbi:hypothetical protein GQ53DRAFT_744675, partial [Thozetella sp. PMI_491]